MIIQQYCPVGSALIETKFHAPQARKEWVEREDLVARLGRVNAKLVLVAAPAGFGHEDRKSVV